MLRFLLLVLLPFMWACGTSPAVDSGAAAGAGPAESIQSEGARTQAIAAEQGLRPQNSAALPGSSQSSEDASEVAADAGDARATDATKPTEGVIEVVELPEVSKSATPPATATRMAQDDVVCRREIPTGSRIPVRVCRSRSEIERRQEADREWTNEVQNSGFSGGGVIMR